MIKASAYFASGPNGRRPRLALPVSLVLGLCLSIAGAGCASSGGDDGMKPLERSVKGYNEAYRWKNFERAAAYLPEDLRMAFIATYEEDEKSLHVEDYQVLRVKMLNEAAADVVIRLTYMMLPSVVVQNRQLVQHWRRVNDVWMLETEENSVRELDLDAKPSNPDAFGGGYDEVGEEGDTSVQVTDPEGNMIRDDEAANAPPPAQPR